LGFKWNPHNRVWEKLWSLKDFEVLESWPDVGISPEAREKARQSRESVARQQKYYRQKAQLPTKTKLKPFTTEEKEAQRRWIEDNHRRRETEIEARWARGEFRDMDDKIARWAKQTQEKMVIRGKRSRAT
jgi:hypothetical protein